MKIKKIRAVTCFYVEVDEGEYTQYIRYGPDSWMVTMGESDESVWACEEIEALFQEHQQSITPKF